MKRLHLLKPTKSIEVTYCPAGNLSFSQERVRLREKAGGPSIPAMQKNRQAGAKAALSSRSPALKKGGLARPKSADLAKSAFGSKISSAMPRLKVSKSGQDSMISALSDEKIFISHKEKDLSDEPAYIDYYNTVRSKIYREADANKPYFFMEGDVKLIFTIAKDGRLLKTDVLNEASTQNSMLTNHALMSIRKASPFPPFNQSVKEDQLTIRLTISFEKQ